MYYIHGSVRAIPTYRVYQLYDWNKYVSENLWEGSKLKVAGR